MFLNNVELYFQNIRLIDYEKMVDANGKRLVAFGKYGLQLLSSLF